MRKNIFMRGLLVLSFLALSASAAIAAETKESSANAEIKKTIIAESIQSYPGRCPCPYSRAKNGSLCGKRSAWSRPGGYAPICYEKDVTDDMVRQWQQRHNQKNNSHQ